MLKIKDYYNLEDLVENYGFKKREFFAHSIYYITLEQHPENSKFFECELLVNSRDDKHGELGIYFGNEFDLGMYEDDADELYFIPEVLFDMIKDGIVERKIK